MQVFATQNLGQLLHRLSHDMAFRSQMQLDPRATFAEVGIDIGDVEIPEHPVLAPPEVLRDEIRVAQSDEGGDQNATLFFFFGGGGG